eukprot:maker-scaffold_21-snap-gene-3.11-mRNA-1 protein AED:0.35 eAED:0.35 QI:0/0/0/1/0/0/2/0/281
MLDASRISIFSPAFDGKWEPMTLDEIGKAQLATGRLSPEETRAIREDKVDVCRRKGKIWIPKEAFPKFLCHFHNTSMHPPATRSYEELTTSYTFDFSSTRLKEILKRLSVVCMHCTKGSKLVRRPRDITVLGSRPREILLMDFLYIDESGYILVLVDSLSRKLQLKKRATALAAARALCWRRSRYGFLQNFVLFTDRGSHFGNKLLDLMQRLFRFSQQWAISYSPFTNGGVETTNGPILRILRTLLSEYRMDDKEWPDLLPHIEYQLNHSVSKVNRGLTSN